MATSARLRVSAPRAVSRRSARSSTKPPERRVGLSADRRSVVNRQMTDDDQKQLVALGYDCIADTYLERFGRSSVRTAKLAELIEQLPADASVLDLGCGAGIPVARELVRLGFDVTGVDASEGQIERARRNVPQARFVQADMATVQFSPETFDAVSAFYSVTHLPRSEHAILIRRVAKWLRPGGRFLASYGAAEGDWSEEWLGTTMFFSQHDPETTKRLIQVAGLRLERVEMLKQDNEEAIFLWATAQKS
jgi:cyclopropane fatty-acyl-phospholipid synthase-like methyltransferase